MLYQEYKQKMKKVVDVLRFIRRIRVPIIVAVSAILILLGAYLATKGIVYGAVLNDNTIEYGDKISFSANALFSDVSYEYRQEGSDVWTSEAPTRMGNYYARAVSKGSFGERYGKEQAFTIGARHIDVLIKENSVTYGENPTVTADLVFGDTISCQGYTFENTTLAKTSVIPHTDTVVIRDINGNDVTECYILKAKAKEITFDKRDITLTVGSASKEYDGKPLKCDDVWQVNDGGLVFGDTVVKVEGTFSVIIGAGSVDNKGQFKVIRALDDGSVVDVTHQYNVNQKAGTLTVDQKPITVYPQGGEYVYDGKPHLEKGFTIDEKTPLAEGDSATVKEAPSITAVGEIENLLIFTILDADGESDVTDNYCFTYAGDLALRVIKRDVTVETPSLELVYDGKEHKSEIGAVSSDTSLGEGHSLATVKATAIKNAETLENVLEIIVKDENGSDVTSNYNITYVNGLLTVMQREINITSDTLNGTYDGSEQYLHSVTYGEGQLSEGHTIKPVFTKTVKYCNTVVDNEFTVEILDENGENVTPNYAYDLSYGTLSLSPMPIAIETDSMTKSYDGEWLKHESFTYVGENKIVEGQNIVYVGAPSIINAEKKDNIFTVQIFEGETDVTYNYDIIYDTYGVIEITKRVITVTANSASKEYYDAQAMENPGYTVGGMGIASGQREEVTVEAEDYVNAGAWKNSVLSVNVYDGEEDVTSNYDITDCDGEITIGKRPIVIMSAQFDQKVYYDGEKHTLYEFYVVDNLQTGMYIPALPLIQGHKIDVTFLEESYVEYAVSPQLNYFNVDRIYVEESGENVTSNYSVSQIYGELKLEKRPVTFISDSIPENTVVYDGYEHTLHSFTVSENEGMGLVNGHVANSSFTGAITDAGKTENKFEIYQILDKNGKDVTVNYERSHQYGMLNVYQRPITLTSQGAAKVYNGIALSNRDVTVGGMGWADNQYASYGNFVALTDAGRMNNTFEVIYIYSKANHSLAEINKENYDITYDFTAELVVTKRPVTIIVNSVSKVYDGEVLENAGISVDICQNYIVKHTGLLPNHNNIEMELSGSIKYVGTQKISYVYPKIFPISNGEEEVDEVTENYEITIIDGSLTVTQRDVTLNVPDFEKEYDGYELLPLFLNENVGGLGLVKEDYVITELLGSQTDVGTSFSSVTKYSFFDGDTDITYCYNVTESANGTLTVTPRQIIITVLGNYKEYYDGGAITSQGYSADRLLTELGHTLDISVVGSQINVGSSYAVALGETLTVTDGNGKNITYNYEVSEYIDGELTVEKKRPITVVSADGEFLYDGQEHKNESYEILLNENSMGLATLREEIELVVFENEPMIDAGLYVNKFTVTVSVKDSGEDTTPNYEITYEYGSIVIEKIKLTVTTQSSEKIYDGTPLTNEEITVEYENLPKGYKLEAYTTGSIINVGSARNVYKLTVYNENGEKISNTNFDITENLGTLTVNKLKLTVTTGSAEKTYDGTPLTNLEFTSNWNETEASKKGALNLNVLVTGTRTDVGRSNNTALVFVYDGQGEDVSKDNCDITVEAGELTVYAPALTFVSSSMNFLYDGMGKTYKGAELKDDGIGYISDSHLAVFEFTNEYVAVGEYENVFTVTVVDAKTRESVMEFYPNVTCEYGTVTIEKRSITIVAPSQKVKYTQGTVVYAPSEIVMPNEDLDELNNLKIGVEYTYSIDDMSDFFASQPGEKLVYAIPPERFHIYMNGEAVDMSGFEITSVEGYIKLSEHLLEINLYKIVKAYNGKLVSYKEDDWYLKDGQLPEGYTLDLKLEGGLTQVGSLDLDILLEELLAKGNVHVYNSSGEDVTENFDFVFVGTPLTVTTRKLQITAGSAEKVYDGKPLTDASYTITSGTLARGDEIQFIQVIGSITNVGSTINEIGGVVIKNANGEDVTDNYDIERIEGTLTVIKDEQNS